MSDMRLFAQITKVDEAKRLVYGRAVQEVPDRADEIFDYASSKQHFVDWSKSFAEDTAGKSLGNLRAMHGKVAAGKLTAIDFNDEAKAIDIAAKVVDDAEWGKVQEGVYTGFSIGGSYVGEKKTEKLDDGREIKRYTAKPAEISLVDSPCIPTARFFEVVKADGTLEKKAFQHEVKIEGTETQVDDFVAVMKAKDLTMADVLDLLAKFKGKEAKDKQDEGDGDEKEDEKEPDKEEKAVQDYLKRDFTQEQRDKAADSGAALPDGSFPIQNKGDLSNAIHAYGRAKDKAKAKAHIIARAKALGASDMLPEDWGKATPPGDLAKPLIDSDTDEARSANIASEIKAGKSREQAAAIAYDIQRKAKAKKKSEEVGDLVKIMADTLDAVEKAKMTAMHKDSIQAIHDHAANMGAECESEKSEPAGELAKRDDTIKALEERIRKLEAQPMPYVTLRAVPRETAVAKDEPIPEMPALEKVDYILNMDGSVDWAASYAMKRYKLAVAKEPAASR